MNQILVTEKLYITPELKRKKKIYKFNFIISIFLIIILISLYIYAEYDRNKSEQVSQQILEDLNTSQEAEEVKKKSQSDILTVVLNRNQEDAKIIALDSKENEVPEKKKYKSASGYEYYTIATISIPSINVNYPIIQGETKSEKETEELLKLSPCKLEGPEPNEKGNFCIIAHNYRNSKFFSKVPNLQEGEKVYITDLNGRTLIYEIYKKYIVDPTDLSCLDQETKNRKEITLITCTDDSTQRVIVKAKSIAVK